MAHAQVKITAKDGQLYYTYESPKLDTIPVWVVFIDSIRLYAAHPEYDIRLEVAPGWRINYGWKAEWVDQEGHKFNPDNVILDRPRKPRPNPFKE